MTLKNYVSLVRSVLEYSAVVFHSQISRYQSNRLENVQKRCLRIMYGYNKTYEELLKLSGLQSLQERRRSQFKKFAEKMSSNPNYSRFFPLNQTAANTRHAKTYKEFFARTDRLYKNPLYAMCRLVNQTPDSDRYNNPLYEDLSHFFNDPY